jgi:acyl-CoA thioesterase-1
MFKKITLLILILINYTSFAATTEKILILGDSLTEGYGVDEQYAYPAVLQELLNQEKLDYKIINGGVSGSTTASGISRLRWFLKAKPTILIIALGANDGLRGLKTSDTKNNLEKIILAAKKRNLKIILAGMQMPPNYGADYVKDYKKIFPKLAKEQNITLIPLLIEGVAGNKKLNIEDGIHPNRKGHEVIAKHVYSFLKELL